jgi:hypothetical protein
MLQFPAIADLAIGVESKFNFWVWDGLKYNSLLLILGVSRLDAKRKNRARKKQYVPEKTREK